MTEQTVSEGMLKLLKNSGIKESQLKELVATAEGLGKKGFSIHDTFPLGIVIPDSIGITTTLSPDKMDLIKDILNDLRVSDVKIFPLGIIRPELLKVDIRLR